MRLHIQTADTDTGETTELNIEHKTRNLEYDDIEVQVMVTMNSLDVENDPQLAEKASVKEIVEAYEMGNVPLDDRGEGTGEYFLDLMTKPKEVTFADKDQMMYTSFDAEDDSESAAPQPPTSNQTRQTKIIYKPPSNVVLTQALQRRTQKDDAYVGPLLTISPGEELDFCVTDDGRESLDILSLSNNTGGHVAFKVKTTSPEKYRVRPSTGVVKPNGSAEISVYLHPGHHGSVIKDKFLVMYMEVNAETSSLQVNDLFKTASRDKYIEHRLRCKLGQPKAAGSDEPKTEMARLQDAMSKLTHQVESLTKTNSRLERRLSQMFTFQLLMFFILIVVVVGFSLMYWLDYIPLNRYTVNACIPYHLS